MYAKVEELQEIAAGVAVFTTASFVSENRFVGLEHQERMLRRRDELERFLIEAGVPEEPTSEFDQANHHDGRLGPAQGDCCERSGCMESPAGNFTD